MIKRPHNYDKSVSEYIAKYTLETIFPQEYESLIKGDKPDLRTENTSVGIEVTRVVWGKDKEATTYFKKHLSQRTLSSVPNEIVENFLKYGNECIIGSSVKPEWDDLIIGFATSQSGTNFEGLRTAVIDKCNKLKSGSYLQCNFYDLYVIWQDLYEDEIPDVYTVLNTMTPLCLSFRFIFIDTNESVWLFDLYKQQYQKYETKVYLKDIVAKARVAALTNRGL